MLKGLTDRILQKTAVSLFDRLDRFLTKPFNTFPFGPSPLADTDTYRKRWDEARGRTYPQVDAFEQVSGFAVEREWLDQLALQTQVVIKEEAICYAHGRLLYARLRQYLEQTGTDCISIIETGTARGFSSLVMARALQDHKRKGSIYTLDVLPHTIPMYWNCIADAEGPRSRNELLADYRDLAEGCIAYLQGDSVRTLERLHLGRIHFAFLDGMHTYPYIMKEFGLIHPRQQEGDIVFFDDYTPAEFPGVVKAVDEICEKYNYEKQIISLSDERGYAIATRQAS